MKNIELFIFSLPSLWVCSHLHMGRGFEVWSIAALGQIDDGFCGGFVFWAASLSGSQIETETSQKRLDYESRTMVFQKITRQSVFRQPETIASRGHQYFA